jgi:hypothetical protein
MRAIAEATRDIVMSAKRATNRAGGRTSFRGDSVFGDVEYEVRYLVQDRVSPGAGEQWRAIFSALTDIDKLS